MAVGGERGGEQRGVGMPSGLMGGKGPEKTLDRRRATMAMAEGTDLRATEKAE